MLNSLHAFFTHHHQVLAAIEKQQSKNLWKNEEERERKIESKQRKFIQFS